MDDLSDVERRAIMSKLYDGRPKNEQDTFLQGLMEAKAIQRRRSRNGDPIKQRSSNFLYFIMKDSDRVPVCKQAFMSLYAISHFRIQRLNTLLATGQSPRDLRGLHNNRPRALCDDWIVKVKNHIESFPVKTAHYSSKTYLYLDANLNVKIMYDLFLKKYPDLKGKVKYEYFLKHFKDNYNLKFGRPQVDVCSECERLNARVKDPNLNDIAKRVAIAELMVHKRRAKKFYAKLKEVEEKCSTQKEVMGLTFDYIQNMPLPHIPVQEIFYYRQLWVYGFEVHDIKNNKGHFYTYHEGQARKGPDEVCTFLQDYITKYVPLEITELHLFSDGCPGQNRNHTMVRFLLALQATKRFKRIYHYFPVRGHSFLPCDRDFGTVKRVFRRHDRVYTPEDYDEMIKSARKTSPFTVHQVQSSDIINFKNWWPVSYKKTCTSVRANRSNTRTETFTISNYRQFLYDSNTPGYVITWEYIDGLSSFTFKLLKQNKENPALPTEKVYTTPVPINQKKIDDIKKVMQYITGENLEFYYHVTSWCTTDAEENP